MSRSLERRLPHATLAVLFLVAYAARPLLPVDETRYLTVPWEMWLSGDHFLLTLNGTPYEHKPPLLFWLINAAWSLLGVGRASAMVVVFLLAALALELTRRLALALFPGRGDIARRAPWLLLGNAAFLYFCTFIEFDVLLSTCVLAATLALLASARGEGAGQGLGRRGLAFAALAGVCVGLGVLAKGPVMLVHMLWPVALYPLWRDPARHVASGAFFRGVALVFACGLATVAVWLAPVAVLSHGEFIRDLVWRQTAGRVTGDLEVAHARPLLWYLPMMPVAFLPWIALPWFWRGGAASQARDWLRGRLDDPGRRSLNLLGLWFIGVILVFSLIAGKQAKYLLPAVPIASLLLAFFLAAMPARTVRNVALLAAGAFALSQVAGTFFLFPKRDLTGAAAFMAAHRDAEWGVVPKYEGEFNFLARLPKPLTLVEDDQAAAWLAAAPNRFLVDKDGDVEDVTTPPLYTQRYRRNELRIFGPAR